MSVNTSGGDKLTNRQTGAEGVGSLAWKGLDRFVAAALE